MRSSRPGRSPYTLTYTLTGALSLTEKGDAALVWDAIPATRPPVDSAHITVTLPAGRMLTTDCVLGAAAQPCTTARGADGSASFGQDGVPDETFVTVTAVFDRTAVAHATPDVGMNGGTRLWILRAVAVLVSAVAGALGVRGVSALKSNRRDLRFLDEPPGGVPSRDDAPVGQDSRPSVAPTLVAPSLSLASAGLIMDARYEPSHALAQLTDLACRDLVEGHLEGDRLATNVVRPTPHDDVDAAIIATLREPGTGAGAVSRLLASQAEERAASYLDGPLPPRRRRGRLEGGAALVGVVLSLIYLIFRSLHDESDVAFLEQWWVAPLLVGAIVVAVSAAMLTGRPRRTPLGRAYADQIEALRLGMAEADPASLAGREGDILRLLPWAVLFGTTKHWARLAHDLGVPLASPAGRDLRWTLRPGLDEHLDAES